VIDEQESATSNDRICNSFSKDATGRKKYATVAGKALYMGMRTANFRPITRSKHIKINQMKKILFIAAISLFAFNACKKESPASATTGSSGSGPVKPNDQPPTPVPQPFSAKFTYTSSGGDLNNIFEKENIHLECKASGVVQYVWNLGNGTKVLGNNIDVTYTYHGVYPVTLTVTDKDGKTATSTQQVTILCNFGGSH
jgi:hypothetical protein